MNTFPILNDTAVLLRAARMASLSYRASAVHQYHRYTRYYELPGRTGVSGETSRVPDAVYHVNSTIEVRPADHVPERQPRILLGMSMFEAQSVNDVKNTVHRKDCTQLSVTFVLFHKVEPVCHLL